MVRPRSEEAHQKVLEAAAELFAERGLDGTSMDAIAEASTVSKATIYKHWADKDALCLEVLGYIHGLDEPRPAFLSEDFRADLIAQLRYEPAVERKAMKEKIWPHLVAYSARNPEFGRAWRAKIMEPARQGLICMVRRGEAEGLLNMKKVDPDSALAILLGPLIYRQVFIQRLGGTVPPDLEAHIADAFLGAFGCGGLQNGNTRRRRRPKT
ncbi:MAG TPA: TetR/AcrR family transcriptional regulator [Acidisarcina sp.]